MLHGRPRALRDPQPPGPVDQLGPFALLGRHRQDDRLDAVELSLVDLHVLKLVAGESGNHAEQARERAHFPDRLQLREEVVQPELVASQLAFERERVVLLELALGLLDQRHHVSHPEDPLGHAVGVEALELLELLAGGGIHDRPAGDRLDAERRPAACVAVELGHDHAVELDGLREALGDVHGVLSGHRVDDEQHVVRFHRGADPNELGHQLLVDVQPPAGVDDQDVLALLTGALERPRGDLHGVALGALLIDGGSRLGADLHELLDGRRSVDVA